MQEVSTDSHLLTLILERLTHIEGRMEADKTAAIDSRRRVHDKLEQHGNLLIVIDHRVTTVEKAVDGAAPQLKEYTEVKAKIAGAGMLGIRLWKIGVWLLGAAVGIYALRHDISAWWQWLITPK